MTDINDTRSCGEMSCDECNDRTEALRARIAELEGERDELRKAHRCPLVTDCPLYVEPGD